MNVRSRARIIGRSRPPDRQRLLAGPLLFTGRDSPRVADIASVPTRKRPVRDDLGIDDNLDEYVEQRDGFEIFELVGADLTQLSISGLRIGDLQEILPHLVDLIGLKDVSDALTDVEDSELRLYRLLRGRDSPEVPTGFPLLQLGAHGSNPVGLFQRYLDAHLSQLNGHGFHQRDHLRSAGEGI